MISLLSITRHLESRLTLACVACLFIAGCGQSATETQTASTSTADTEQATPEIQVEPTADVEIAQADERPELNWQTLPFIAESDKVLTVVKPSVMAKSEAVSALLTALPFGDTELKIAPADTDWIAIYATPLVNDDNSFTGMATMVIKLNRPASVYEVAESRFPEEQFDEIQTEDLSYLRAMERKSDDYISPAIAGPNAAVPMAIFEYDESTYVICEEGRLSFILDQTASPNSLKELVANTADEFQLLIAADVSEAPVVKEAVVANAAELSKDGILETLAAKANTLVLEANLDADSLMRIAVTTAADEDTVTIEGSIAEFQTSAKEFLQQMELFTTPETKALLTTGQQLIEQLVVARDASSIEMEFRKPGDLSPFFKSLQSLLGQEVAAIEAK